MPRSLLLLALAVLAASASAQPVQDGPYYNGLDAPRDEDRRGVRVGLGVGAYVYSGPFFDTVGRQQSDDALATNLGVTAEITFPLSGPFYGRLMGGLLNIGANDDPDGDGVSDAAFNPFYTGQTALAEADLLYYIGAPRAGRLSPYLFSGLSGLFATRGAASGVPKTTLAVPVGLGVEYGVSRNLSLYAEGSYRFGLTDISPEVGGVVLAAVSGRVDVCNAASAEYDFEACKAQNGTPFCPNGFDPATRCTEVSDNGDVGDNRDRFNSGLIVGGLRLGFGRAPAPPAVPAYVPPPAPAVAPAPPVVVPSVPEVCDLVELNSIYFDFGAGTLDGRARSLLDENVGLLLDNPACCVFIDGYTDTPEGDRFGLNLAGRRAQAVYDYYLSRGVDAERLQVRNRGVAVPNCDKEDPGPGCERNRRVESLPVDCERFQFLLENPSYDPY